MPVPRMPRNIRKPICRCLPKVATAVAPTTLPAPRQALSAPKTCGPECSSFSTNSGSSSTYDCPRTNGIIIASVSVHQVAVGAQVGPAFAHVGEDAFRGAALDVAEGGGDGQHQEQGDDEGAGGGEVGGGDAQAGDEDAADGRPGDARQAVTGGVQRDGVHQMLLGDEARGHGLAGGNAPGEEKAVEGGRQDDAPDGDEARRDEDADHERDGEDDDVAGCKEVAPVDAVGDDAHGYRAEAGGEAPRRRRPRRGGTPTS